MKTMPSSHIKKEIALIGQPHPICKPFLCPQPINEHGDTIPRNLSPIYTG